MHGPHEDPAYLAIHPRAGRYDGAGHPLAGRASRRVRETCRVGSEVRQRRTADRHNDMVGCLVFRPIVDLTTDDVWEFLGTEAPPWGGSHSALITLYRNSLGGECPVVVGKSDAPSCGTSSSRFGCWTCTVVQKDRSLEGFVEAGFSEFGPLLEFRDWLSTIRNDPTRRSARRRNGKFTINDSGTFVPGPFTPDTRPSPFGRSRGHGDGTRETACARG